MCVFFLKLCKMSLGVFSKLSFLNTVVLSVSVVFPNSVDFPQGVVFHNLLLWTFKKLFFQKKQKIYNMLFLLLFFKNFTGHNVPTRLDTLCTRCEQTDTNPICTSLYTHSKFVRTEYELVYELHPMVCTKFVDTKVVQTQKFWKQTSYGLFWKVCTFCTNRVCTKPIQTWYKPHTNSLYAVSKLFVFDLYWLCI